MSETSSLEIPALSETGYIALLAVLLFVITLKNWSKKSNNISGVT